MIIHYFFIFSLGFIAWMAGYSTSTLLQTCEGENLQNCVSKAESILQNTNMTFPDDNETLQMVCRMWDEMTNCTYDYTQRCLTYRENQEFHQYFQEPMNSMKTVCTNQHSSTHEYFKHAHCIKKISTGKKYCGSHYQVMIDQILSVSMNTMKKICCALVDFKDCVMKMNVNHVCVGGPEEKHPFDEDIAAYALKTLDKSLLAFVSHSCVKEGFLRPESCKAEISKSNELGYVRESRTEGQVDGTTTSKPPAPDTTNTNELDSVSTLITSTFTTKPLLVPLSSFPPSQPTRPNQMHVNITSSGDKGKSSVTSLNSSHLDVPEHVNISQVVPEKLNASDPAGRRVTERIVVVGKSSESTSMKPHHPTVTSTTKSAATTTEKREQDLDSPHLTDGDMSPVPTRSLPPQFQDTLHNMTMHVDSVNKSGRVGGGRSLNFIDTHLHAEENKIVTKVAAESFNETLVDLEKKPSPTSSTNGAAMTTTSSRKPHGGAGETLRTTSRTKSTSSSVTMLPPTPATKVTTWKSSSSFASSSSTSTTTTTTTSTTTWRTTTLKPKKPRILNAGSAHSLAALNQALGLAPPSTTPSPTKKHDFKSRKTKPQSVSGTNATKTEESKNSGNFSLSEVPIKVFMVWLSTFFV